MLHIFCRISYLRWVIQRESEEKNTHDADKIPYRFSCPKFFFAMRIFLVNTNKIMQTIFNLRNYPPNLGDPIRGHRLKWWLRFLYPLHPPSMPESRSYRARCRDATTCKHKSELRKLWKLSRMHNRNIFSIIPSFPFSFNNGKCLYAHEHN